MSDAWTVVDTARDNEREVDSRSEAEEKKNDMVSLGADPGDLEIRPPDGRDQSEPEPGAEADGGTEVVETSSETATDELPDKPPVDTDPLTWIPDEFQDTIDGTVAINRKGFEVLAQHYEIEVRVELVEPLTDIDDGVVVHKATAETSDGRVYTAYGEAHAAAGDDAHQLVRLSDTRAYKRAVSRATGVGMVAVEELKSELTGEQ